MTDLGIESWQVPLLVAVAVILVEMAVNAVLRRRANPAIGKRVRTAGLALLLALSVVMFVVLLGPSLAESLSSVAAAVAALMALWLTYRSLQSPPEAGRGGTGGRSPQPAGEPPAGEPAAGQPAAGPPTVGEPAAGPPTAGQVNGSRGSAGQRAVEELPGELLAPVPVPPGGSRHAPNVDAARPREPARDTRTDPRASGFRWRRPGRKAGRDG